VTGAGLDLFEEAGLGFFDRKAGNFFKAAFLFVELSSL
jgi:hypothetical protein